MVFHKSAESMEDLFDKISRAKDKAGEKPLVVLLGESHLFPVSGDILRGLGEQCEKNFGKTALVLEGLWTNYTKRCFPLLSKPSIFKSSVHYLEEVYRGQQLTQVYNAVFGLESNKTDIITGFKPRTLEEIYHRIFVNLYDSKSIHSLLKHVGEYVESRQHFLMEDWRLVDCHGKLLSTKESRIFCNSDNPDSFDTFELVYDHAVFCYLVDGKHRVHYGNIAWADVINNIIKKGFKQIIVLCGSDHIPDMKGGNFNTKGLACLLQGNIYKLTLCLTPDSLQKNTTVTNEYKYYSPDNYNSYGFFNDSISLRGLLQESKEVIAMRLNRSKVSGK